MSDANAAGRGNRVLAALPEDEYERCVQQLSLEDLTLRQAVFETDQPIRDVYFPLTAVVSLVVPMSDGAAAEAATVGNEGVVGVPVFPGAHTLPLTAFAQVPGRALRMDASAFRELCAQTDGPLARVLQRYNQTLFTQLAQNVACNQLHSVEQRAARWLLMTADRAGEPHFTLTQEFLAQMLGVRRASVNEVAGRLAQAGLITYSRGTVTVLDRDRLEHTSCECYQVIYNASERTLGNLNAAPARSNPTSTHGDHA